MQAILKFYLMWAISLNIQDKFEREALKEQCPWNTKVQTYSATEKGNETWVYNSMQRVDNSKGQLLVTSSPVGLMLCKCVINA